MPSFNPFSPTSAAQLQSLQGLQGLAGLSELFSGAGGGSAAGMDFNNQLASIMAAAAALQPQTGGPAQTNPFLMPPFASPAPANSQLPASFFADILAAAAGTGAPSHGSFDEITAAAAASLAAAMQLPPPTSLPAPAHSPLPTKPDPRPPSNSSSASSSIKQPTRPKDFPKSRDETDKKKPAPTLGFLSTFFVYIFLKISQK